MNRRQKITVKIRGETKKMRNLKKTRIAMARKSIQDVTDEEKIVTRKQKQH